jgi:hypothetical protein
MALSYPGHVAGEEGWTTRRACAVADEKYGATDSAAARRVNFLRLILFMKLIRRIIPWMPVFFL